MSKPKDAPAAPPAEIIPPAKGTKNNAPERDPELDGLMSEIEADVREEELRKIWQRYGKTIIAVIAIFILGVVGFEVWRERQAEQRLAMAASYDQAMKQIQAGNTTEGLEGLAKVAGHSAEGYAAIAALQRAATLLKQNDTDGAVAIYKSLAENRRADEAFRQLATVLHVLHAMDRAPAKDLEPLLAPLLNPANPFNSSALELSAVLAMKQGDTARAVKLLDEILSDTNTPSNMVARAKDLRAYYTSLLPPTAAPSTPAATPAPAKP